MEETKTTKNNNVRNSVVGVIFIVLLALVTMPIWNNGSQSSSVGQNGVQTADATGSGETTETSSVETSGSEVSNAENAKVFPAAALAATGDNKIFDSSTGEVITIPQSDPETENQEMIMDSRTGALTPVPKSDPGN